MIVKRSAIWTALTGMVLGAGAAAFLMWPEQSFLKKTDEETVEAVSAQAAAVKKGSLPQNVEGRGRLEYGEAESISLPSGIEVEEIRVEAGERVKKGQVLAVLDEDSIQRAMADLQEEVAQLDEKMEELLKAEEEQNIQADLSGRVKNLYAREGDEVQEVMLSKGTLAEISTDGKMALQIRTESKLNPGDTVEVRSDGKETWEGTVEEAGGKVYEITLTDDGPKSGENAAVWDEKGNLLGSGVLYIHQPVSVIGHTGTIHRISVDEGEMIQKGDVLFTLDSRQERDSAGLEGERQEKEEKLQELLRLAQEGNITAETEKIIGEICEKETQEDGEVQEEDWTVLTVFPADRMKICVPVREQEILSVREGQKALVEVNAVPGTQLEGVVSQVGTQAEYAGGAVVYMAEVTVKTDGGEDFWEGMSAAVRIQTGEKEEALLLPIQAVWEEEERQFAYTEKDPKTGKLSGRVEIQIGDSDGEQVEILEGLEEGSVVYYSEG